MKNKHVFAVNDSNSGEALLLTTQFDDAGHMGQQEIKLNSYVNGMSVTLGDGSFTPAKLRLLADELEKYSKDIVARQKV